MFSVLVYEPSVNLWGRLTNKQLSHREPWAWQEPWSTPAIPGASIHAKSFMMALQAQVPVLGRAVVAPLHVLLFLPQNEGNNQVDENFWNLLGD